MFFKESEEEMKLSVNTKVCQGVGSGPAGQCKYMFVKESEVEL